MQVRVTTALQYSSLRAKALAASPQKRSRNASSLKQTQISYCVFRRHVISGPTQLVVFLLSCHLATTIWPHSNQTAGQNQIKCMLSADMLIEFRPQLLSF